MYERINWKARRGTGLNKFTESERSGNTVVLVNTPDTITEAGTEISPANLNHMDEGIERAHVDIANEVRERQQEIEALKDGLAQIISLIESNFGPMSRIPMVMDDGTFIVTDDGDYILVA